MIGQKKKAAAAAAAATFAGTSVNMKEREKKKTESVRGERRGQTEIRGTQPCGTAD